MSSDDSDATVPANDSKNHVIVDQTSQQPVFHVATEEISIEHCSASDETVESIASPGTEITEHFERVALVEIPEEKTVDSQIDEMKDPDGTKQSSEAQESAEFSDSQSRSVSSAAEIPEASGSRDEGCLGDAEVEELNVLYDNFVALAAALNVWCEGEKDSRANQIRRAEALYENIPFVYEQLLRERSQTDDETINGSSNSEVAAPVPNNPEVIDEDKEPLNLSSEDTSHSPSTVAWELEKMHLQDGACDPVSVEASPRPYSGIYGESELEELESEHDRSDALSFEDVESFISSGIGEDVPSDSSDSTLNEESAPEDEKFVGSDPSAWCANVAANPGECNCSDESENNVKAELDQMELSEGRAKPTNCSQDKDREQEEIAHANSGLFQISADPDTDEFFDAVTSTYELNEDEFCETDSALKLPSSVVQRDGVGELRLSGKLQEKDSKESTMNQADISNCTEEKEQSTSLLKTSTAVDNEALNLECCCSKEELETRRVNVLPGNEPDSAAEDNQVSENDVLSTANSTGEMLDSVHHVQEECSEHEHEGFVTSFGKEVRTQTRVGEKRFVTGGKGEENVKEEPSTSCSSDHSSQHQTEVLDTYFGAENRSQEKQRTDDAEEATESRRVETGEERDSESDTREGHPQLGDSGLSGSEMELSQSQVDLVRAVTQAFGDILELHEEESDTKL